MTSDPAGIPPSDGGSAFVPPVFKGVPAMLPNGQKAARKPLPAAVQTAHAAQQTAEGIALLAQAAAQFPQILAAVLSQVPVRVIPAVRNLCAPCILARLQWQAAHAAGIKQAEGAAREAHGIGADDPTPPGLDWVPFLDPALSPGAGPQGITPLNPSITTVNGTEVCADHIPGKPGATTLLIATASLAPSQMGRFGI